LLASGAPCQYTEEQEEQEQQEEQEIVQQSLTRSWLLGWLLAVLSGILFTSNNFLVKYFTLEAVEVLMVRSSLQTLLMALIIVLTKRSFLPAKRLDLVLVLLQGLFTGLRILFTFSSVLYMPLGDSLTIVFTEPLWTILLSRIILSIKISAWKILFGCLLVCGLVLCVQPPFLFPAGDVGHVGPQYYLGVLLALGAASDRCLGRGRVPREGREGTAAARDARLRHEGLEGTYSESFVCGQHSVSFGI